MNKINLKMLRAKAEVWRAMAASYRAEPYRRSSKMTIGSDAGFAAGMAAAFDICARNLEEGLGLIEPTND